MLYYFIIPFVSVIQLCSSLHCRDIDNNPVDWWYIYKPPSNSGPGLHSGLHLYYITSKTAGRWQYSASVITAKNSMLDYTLAPLFSERYMNYLAVLVYKGRPATYLEDGSSAFGVLMADELGGLWMTHSVQDLIDLTENAFVFPTNQIDDGHVLMCMSLDLMTLNEIANALRHLAVNIVHQKIPLKMETHLPYWYLLKSPRVKGTDIKRMHFLTRGETLHGVVLARPPGDPRCLYKSFARNYTVVLDVYGHGHKDNICKANFSVRNIEAISLKHPSDGFPHVWYIDNSTDRLGFAVSTAAAWQRQAISTEQHWTCISNVERQDNNFKAGLIVCVNDYRVWLTFDNLKIKEPDC